LCFQEIVLKRRLRPVFRANVQAIQSNVFTSIQGRIGLVAAAF
jgi:hypothetical protein